MTTPTLREAAQAALEALESLQGGCTDSNDGTVEAITVWCPEVIDELRAALAQPVPDTQAAWNEGFKHGQWLAKHGAAQPVPDAALQTAVRLVLDATPDQLPMALDALRDHAGAAPVAQQAEPPGADYRAMWRRAADECSDLLRANAALTTKLVAAAHPQQPARVPLTAAQVEALAKAAFYDGFTSPETYNDTLLNDVDAEWEKQRAGILRAHGIVPAPTTDTTQSNPQR